MARAPLEGRVEQRARLERHDGRGRRLRVHDPHASPGLGQEQPAIGQRRQLCGEAHVARDDVRRRTGWHDGQERAGAAGTAGVGQRRRGSRPRAVIF